MALAPAERAQIQGSERTSEANAAPGTLLAKDYLIVPTHDEETMKNIAIITALALFHGIGCASAGPDSDWEDEADVGSVEQAQQAAQGQDAPGKSCIRNNRNGSSTSGKCEDVCKDKTIYEPHPSEDPAGTYGICKEAARVRADAFTQVFSEAASAATLSQ